MNKTNFKIQSKTAEQQAYEELDASVQKWQFLYPKKKITARVSTKNKKHMQYINMRMTEISKKMSMSPKTQLLHKAIAKEIRVDGVSVGNPHKSYEFQDYKEAIKIAKENLEQLKYFFWEEKPVKHIYEGNY